MNACAAIDSGDASFPALAVTSKAPSVIIGRAARPVGFAPRGSALASLF